MCAEPVLELGPNGVYLLSPVLAKDEALAIHPEGFTSFPFSVGTGYA